MDIVSYTAIRNNLAKALDQVNDDCAPIIITRQKGKPAVLISLEEFRSWEETLHLMRSPKNAARLNRAIVSIEAGRVRRRALLPARFSGQPKPGKTISGGKKKNPKIFARINTLIQHALRSPFQGIGKPEPLKHRWSGYWSRRITEEHRLVYKPGQGEITIAQCRYHY